MTPRLSPSAWLSGVYYPKIPDVVRADDPAHAGWIEFGRAPEDFHTTTEPEAIAALWRHYTGGRQRMGREEYTRFAVEVAEQLSSMSQDVDASMAAVEAEARARALS